MLRTALVAGLLISTAAASAQTLGTYSSNPYAAGRAPDYSPPTYGNERQLYTNDGNFRGNLNSNRYDPDSVANPYGQYGSRYSPDSINNPYGAGSRYNSDSPSNPYGQGLKICGIGGCD